MHLSEAARARCPIVKIADGEDLGKFVVSKRQLFDRCLHQTHAAGADRLLVPRLRLIEHHVGRIDASDRRRGGSFNDNTDGLTGAKPELEHGILRADVEQFYGRLIHARVIEIHPPTDESSDQAGGPPELFSQ